MPRKVRLNLKGKRFCRLTVIRFAGIVNRGSAWLCKCNCGAEKIIRARDLMSGRILSCGCLKRSRASEANKGDGNGMWAGDEVKYGSLHDWARNNKPKPEFCEVCGKKKPLDLASIGHTYSRNLDEWRWLCRGCHMKVDIASGFRLISRRDK